MPGKNICVIINPYSAGGKTYNITGEIISRFVKYFGVNNSIYCTENKTDAAEKVRREILSGCKMVISVGGDGTIQGVVKGFFNNGELTNPDCGLGIISSGTGQGFVQSIGLPPSIDDQFKVLKSEAYKYCDLGCIEFLNNNTPPQFFINEFQAGIGGAVVKNIKPFHRFLGSRATFGISTLSQIYKYRNQYVNIRIDGKEIFAGQAAGVVAANGSFTGGGMNLVPSANPFNQMLNVLIMKNMNPFQRMINFPKIYRGSHIHSSNFLQCTGREIFLTSEEFVPAEADGEILPGPPCKVCIIPSILKVFINPNEVIYETEKRFSETY